MTGPIKTQRQGLRIFYGWRLVGLVLLVNFMTSGAIYSAMGVWVKALGDYFPSWSRTQVTAAFSIAQLEGSVLGPLIGFAVDRLGSRRMVLMGLLTVGAGFIIFSRTTNLPVFYLSFTVIMLGAAAGTFLPLMAAINRWFIRRRAFAMAIGGEGYFISGVALIPALAWAVNPEHAGWRATAFGIGLAFLIVAWPVSRLVRNRPEDYGQLPDGAPSPVVPASLPRDAEIGERGVNVGRRTDFTARQALRMPAFWLITFGHALTAMLIVTLQVHMIPMLTDQGLSLQKAGYVWAVTMAVAGVFQLIGGLIGDRIRKNRAIFVFASIQTVGFAMAILVNNMPMAFLFAVIFGIGFGGRNSLTLAIRGDYFGQKAFATITGLSMAPLYVFIIVAPLFAAAMFDLRGSYHLSFTILAALGSLSGFLYLFAKKPVLVDPIQRPNEAGEPA